MTIAIHIASSDAPSALETAAWHHLDSARGLLDDLNGVVGDPALGPTERAFWQHMNAAWQLIRRVERGQRLH
jgi:hypothetical protein